MKSGGSKIFKEIAKETSKNAPKPLNLSSNTTSSPSKPFHSENQQDNQPKVPSIIEQKLEPINEPSYNIIINSPILDPIVENDLRGVTFKEPLKIVRDNSKSIPDHLRHHEKTHTVVQDQKSSKLIGVLTSSKKFDDEKQFTPVKISHQIFDGKDKDQNFAPFSKPRYVESQHLEEHEDATKLKKNKYQKPCKLLLIILKLIKDRA